MQKMTPDLLGMAFTHPVIQAEVDSAGVITINGQEVTPVDGQAPAVTCISAAVWLVGTQYGDEVLAPMHVRVGQDSRWYVLKGDITGAILRGPNDTNFSPIDALDAMAFASDDQWEALGADAHRTWTSAGAPAAVDIHPDEALAVSGPPSIPSAMGPSAVPSAAPASGDDAAPGAADPTPSPSAPSGAEWRSASADAAAAQSARTLPVPGDLTSAGPYSGAPGAASGPGHAGGQTGGGYQSGTGYQGYAPGYQGYAEPMGPAGPAGPVDPAAPAQPEPVYWLPPEQQAPPASQSPQPPQVPDTRAYPTAPSAPSVPSVPSAYGSYGVVPSAQPSAPQPTAAQPPAVPPAFSPSPAVPPAFPASPAVPAASPAAPTSWSAPAVPSPAAPAPVEPTVQQAEPEPIGLTPEPAGPEPEALAAASSPAPPDDPMPAPSVPDTRPISAPQRWSPEPAAESPAQPQQAAPEAEPFAPTSAPAASQDWNQPMDGMGQPTPSYRYTSRDVPSSGDDSAASGASGSAGGHRVSRRAVLLTVGVVGTAGAVAVLAKTMMGPSTTSAGAAPATPRPTGTIALPSHSAPAPLSSQAVWEAEIKPQTSPLALPDGVAILTPGSTIDVLNTTGARASSQSAPADAQALVLGAMGGTAAIWAVTPTAMSWYPLTGSTLGEPTSITPPQGATVSWVGGSPLFTLPNSSAAGVDSQGVYTVTVPSGHTATAATDSHVLVVDGNAHYSRIARSGALGEGTLVGDGGAGAAPAYICTVTASLVAVGWNDTTGGTLGLFSVDDGSSLASMPGLDLAALPASVVAFPERGAYAVGQVVMTTGDQPAITQAALAPATCDGVYYYGQSESEQWLYAQMSDPTTTQAIDAASPAIPWGGAGDYSFVVDTDAETWKVYALAH